MIFGICKSDWCHSWQNGCCDKEVPKPCSSFNCNSVKNLNDYLILIMKSKRKVKLLLENCKNNKVVQGKICAVTNNTLFILEDTCCVPTAISISTIKHLMPL
jgi:hypothetical protein